MKYLSVGLLFLVSLFHVHNAHAQYSYNPVGFAESSKTVTYDGDELSVYIHFYNNSASPVKVIWRLIEDSIPGDWTIGLCDNVACYYNFNNSLYTAKTSDFVPAGDSIFLKAVFDAHCVSGDGWMKISSKVEDGGFNSPDTLLYSASAIAECQNGIAESGVFSSLKVFPNPITDNLLITSHFISAVPLTIQLTDLQGRVVSDRQRFNLSATLNIQTLPSGSYLLQFLDAANQTVAVRKVFKL